MLKSFKIEVLGDVRSFPGSRKFPHFHKENIEKKLPNEEIEYLHFKDLGGRRKALPNSKNTVWKNISFRSYADYMETEDFENGIKKLKEVASQKRVAIMCSEAVWWRCHRSMISDYLKVEGWKVLHIMNMNKVEEHPFTQPARQIDGKLVYGEKEKT